MHLRPFKIPHPYLFSGFRVVVSYWNSFLIISACTHSPFSMPTLSRSPHQMPLDVLLCLFFFFLDGWLADHFIIVFEDLFLWQSLETLEILCELRRAKTAVYCRKFHRLLGDSVVMNYKLFPGMFLKVGKCGAGGIWLPPPHRLIASWWYLSWYLWHPRVLPTHMLTGSVTQWRYSSGKEIKI